MPYEINEKLPNSIKDSLPSKAQDIWRNAFNSAYEKYKDDEEKCNQIAWGAVKNAGYEKDDKGNWIKKEKFTSFTIKDMEIFSAGIWKGDSYTEDDLDEIVNNYNILKDEIKPCIHIGHDRALENDGQPSLGWLTNLRRKGKKLLTDAIDVPEIVYNAVKKKLYKRISSEIIWGLKHTATNKRYGKVLTGVALVGSAIPAVRTLQDLTVFTLDVEGRKIYSLPVENGLIQNIGGDKMTELEMQKKYTEELTMANKKADAALKEAKEYKEKLEQMAIERENEHKKIIVDGIKTYCEDQVKAGKLAPIARDLIVNEIEKKTYTIKDGYSFTFDQVKAILEKQYTLDMDEKSLNDSGDKTSNVEDKVDITVRKYMKESKLTYTEAMQELLDSDPGFAKMYTEIGYSDKE